MKNIFYSLFFILILSGCETPILEGPPKVDSVELNNDSNQSHLGGTYKVYLKAEHGSNPLFYSNVRYQSGETLLPKSNLQPMIDQKMNAYNDTIAKKNYQIEKLKREKEILESQLQEKTLLIRFLTGK